jgi:hypothetical protein
VPARNSPKLFAGVGLHGRPVHTGRPFFVGVSGGRIGRSYGFTG